MLEMTKMLVRSNEISLPGAANGVKTRFERHVSIKWVSDGGCWRLRRVIVIYIGGYVRYQGGGMFFEGASKDVLRRAIDCVENTD
jgi:hypothetical protein